MHIGNYIGLAHQSEKELANAFKKVAEHHQQEPDVLQTCKLLASWSATHVELLKPFIKKYSENKSNEPEQLKKKLFNKPRSGSLALVRDLHDLWLLANEVNLCWIILLQGARGLRDKALESQCVAFGEETRRQLDWLLGRIKQAAPQSLIVS